ncbi:MAG: type II toxin-antitoxin system VapC family toxin [Acidobacteriota bacterium]|nr:type II toxin-antitoxin system VapC family toxin [Acidobacteriota bacterium]
MSTYFFDSSAIVKRYVSERGTGWVLGVTDPRAGNRILVARITGVEVVAALTRAGRNRGATAAAATATAVRQFRHDFVAEYRIVEVTPSVLGRAMTLAQAHGLRGYDAVQLAAALEIQALRPPTVMSSLTFVSADAELNTAAVTEGLPVNNPNAHP